MTNIQWLGAGIAAVVACGIVAACVVVVGGCAAMQAQYANDTYAAQQIACVDQYSTKAEIDNCRANVRRKWGVGVDAGAEGGAK